MGDSANTIAVKALLLIAVVLVIGLNVALLVLSVVGAA
jgi:hypothetical protein